MYQHFFKHFIDFLTAILVLILILPILVLTVMFIKLDSRGRILFVQERAGKNGFPIRVLKFRTMTDVPREVTREIRKGDPEVTRVGRLLRRYKIDELPQLFNVLMGQMSLVGPRPGLLRQIECLDENGKKRLLVKPGLTGLAQVKGNINLTWPERWKYDRQYVENCSFLLDVKILLKTILIVIFGEDKFTKIPNE